MTENRILFVNGQVFDGTGSPAVPADVVVRGDRIASVRVGGGTETEPGDQVVDCAGATVMPGLVDSHAHLTFPSAVGHIDPSFNPPLDVSFFRHMPTPDEHLAIAKRNAKIMLDHGFTSVYSAGSLTPVPTEVQLRDQIAAGATPGPRMRAASFERDNNPVQLGPDGPQPKKTGPDAVREFIREQAAIGFDSVKLLLSNDDVFVEGGSMITQYSQEEAFAAGEQARQSGVWLNCHAQAPESIKLAVRNGFRSVYHCSYADAEAIDLLEEHKESIFLSPAVGIMWANVYEGAEYGIDTAMAEKMGSVKALRAMTELYPELRKRGLRVLPGGDYGFPNNPIGRNARDLELFVRLFGYSPAEALRATTSYGGQVMDLPVGLLTPGYLADVLVVRGEPAQDVTLLQDTGNLLAIMQNGAFCKLASRRPHDDTARPVTLPVRRVPDVQYGELLGYRPLELDLYLPQAGEPVPVVVYVHGGGWRRGSRRQPLRTLGTDFYATLAAQGFAVAAIDYRLSGEARFPAPLQDVRTAVGWIRDHAASYRLDAGRIFLWGDSSGGHLALLAALTGAEVQGVVAWFPVTDLPGMPSDVADAGGVPDAGPDSREAQLLGAPARSMPGLARQASPVTHASAAAPPILLMHGTADEMVPPAQSIRLAEALDAAGATVQLELVPGAKHFWDGASDVAAIIRRSVEFLHAQG